MWVNGFFNGKLDTKLNISKSGAKIIQIIGQFSAILATESKLRKALDNIDLNQIVSFSKIT